MKSQRRMAGDARSSLVPTGRDDGRPIERKRPASVTSASSADTYTVAEILSYGHGGRAVLYRGVRNADRRPVVLKVLDPSRSRPKDVEQLKHEYEIGSLFDSPAVVKPLAFETYEGMPALVMEDFAATSLDALIDGPMGVERFLTLASRIAAALAELHGKKVVHRDLKPGNILVGPSGEVKLGDLGMASRLARGRASLQSPNRIEGSLPYLSPEQTGRMNRSVDSRSDLYALGVTLYEMLTGTLPFQASDPLSWVHCHVARTPRPPREIVPEIAPVLSDIVLKLLAKLAEDRYQTARGLQYDLESCLTAWRAEGRLTSFPLGQRDASDRFEIAEKLYGREREIRELVRAFERMVASGTPELVLVSGYSGIGKSSLVRELHRPIVREHGLFISGKVDQYRRDIPYSTFTQAFGELLEQILSECAERRAVWRAELQQALGTSGQLIVDLVPQLERIVGPQSAVVPLPPLEAQHRFHTVFRQFVGVFARKEHPLALFIDDLQWIDSGSLSLIEDLLLQPQTRHLLVLGAYRDNEVGPSHPLMLTLDKVRRAAIVRQIVLGPLGVESIGELIGDALHCSRQRAAPLARLVHQKTAGNPFFAIQFLTSLYQEGLLECDRTTFEWSWDSAKIDLKGYTDNVLDLMARKLSRLPAATQNVLKRAACVGNSTDLQTLAMISSQTDEETASHLWDAVAEGLVLQMGNVYAFLHDRVQQGAYALIGDSERKAIHLEIGRILLERLDPRTVEEKVFDVVGHLNRGSDLISDVAERDGLARLDLVAGRKAKASIAYGPARALLAAAAALLPADVWESHYDLAFPVFLESAECEYLSGGFERAEALFAVLLARARTEFDQAAVYELRMKLCQVAGRYDEALTVGLSALRLFGVLIPEDERALEEATSIEAQAVKVSLGDRKIADLANAHEATDPNIRSIISLLATVAAPAYIGSKPKVFPLIVLKLVNYSLTFGHTYESCIGYSAYGLVLVSLFDDPRSAYEFTEMAIELNRRLDDSRRRGAVLHFYGTCVGYWVTPIANCIPIAEKAFLACVDAGDVVYANYTAFEIVWQAVERGDAIDDVRKFSERYAAFARDSRNEPIYRTIRAEQQFLACLKGETRGPASFDDASFEEATCLAKMRDATFGCGLVTIHVMKLVAAYVAGDDDLALRQAAEARRTLLYARGLPTEVTFYYFDALLLARIHSQKNEEEQREILTTIRSHADRLAFWASICPENFLTKHALVTAEIARITGDKLEAERCYEEAIDSARVNGFVHWQAIANELAGYFYRGRGFEVIAKAYLREALSCYQRWGAEAKVAALELRDPQLRGAPPINAATTFVGRAEQLDVLSLVKASQTISGVIMREQLLRTLLQLVLEEGGARRALLLLPGERELSIAAEATVETVTEPVRDSRELEARVPLSVVRYVVGTEQLIVLDDAMIADRFASDPYFMRVRPRSALCLPVRRQAELVALLYIENDLVPGAFTSARLLSLELLAAQAAISLENALLLERERAGRVEAEVAGQRALLLAEGTSLISSTLDYEGVFSALTRLCVQSFADWAIIDLLEGQKTVRLAGTHRDASKEHLLRELCERHAADIDSSVPQAGVLREGKPLHLPAFDDEFVRSVAGDARRAELIIQLGTRSLMVVPLVARDRRLGVLTLAASTPHRFSTADFELAVELGRRTALAIDNARLLHETQRALRLREDFLSLASHELRTPLTALRLTADVLIDAASEGTTFSSATVLRCLRRVVRETERLDDLTGELLDVTLIERGELTIRPSSFDLVELVQEILLRLEPQVRSRCVVSVSGGASIVGAWDRSRVDQAVSSLIANAIKFGAGRPIEIYLRKVDRMAQLVVKDHGIGIEQTWLSRVFERFERGVPVMQYGGLGLGLYIARWIVHAHGGSIDVESTPGVGSKFTIELPLAPPGTMPSVRRSA
ncbi:MAG TPA: ATP-binding sensor histidine kinase [Labilithrix sp.]|nr:ATP-binding sensor histidine kinase [Labilithrix sp.]